MAQITIYVPDEVAKALRREARSAKKSLSQYLVEVATRPKGTRAKWPKGFFDLQGSCGGALEIPEDAPPEEP